MELKLNTLEDYLADVNNWLNPDDYIDEDFCPTCNGEGCGFESDLELDWINYGDRWIVCPDCNGTGVAQ